MGNNNCHIQSQTRLRTMAALNGRESNMSIADNKNMSTRSKIIKIGSKLLRQHKTTPDHDSNHKCISSILCNCLSPKSINKYIEEIPILRNKRCVWDWDILIEEAILASKVSDELNEIIPNEIIDIIKEFSINDPNCYHYKSYISKEYRFKDSNYKILMDKPLCYNWFDSLHCNHEYIQSAFWSLHITLLGSSSVCPFQRIYFVFLFIWCLY